MLDPVFAEAAATPGVEAPIITVTDFKGPRAALNLPRCAGLGSISRDGAGR
jgi:hypothetical protein